MNSFVASLEIRRRPFASWQVASRNLLLGCVAVGLAFGAAGLAVAADDDEDEDPNKPQDISLKTGDGLELKATYYPSTLKPKQKKNAVPIILLHAWKGDRGDCEAFAKYLQGYGHAVVTPDLRGHGQSKEIVQPDGSRIKLEANNMRTADFVMMWSPEIAGESRGGDMEAIKTFLFKKNNAGELNIERLGVVGAEMGATVAVNWAAVDWGWPMLATGKQGQDVKALVLISPDTHFKGLPFVGPLRHTDIGSKLSYLIVVGNPKGRSPKLFQEAKNLDILLQPMHLEPPEDEQATKKSLFFEKVDTNLQGMKLLNEKSIKLDQKIVKFIELRLVNPEYEWTDRRNPLK